MNLDLFDKMLIDIEPDPIERYRLWLIIKSHPYVETIMKKVVLERCLPNPDELNFTSIILEEK